MRIVPPLDNLLFDRARFERLFGRRFLFEAYKPKRERSFYFAMPLIHGARLAGIVDLRLVEGRRLLVERAELVGGETPQTLRAALHRLARLVGAERVSAHPRVESAARKAVDRAGGAVSGRRRQPPNEASGSCASVSKQCTRIRSVSACRSPSSASGAIGLPKLIAKRCRDLLSSS